MKDETRAQAIGKVMQIMSEQNKGSAVVVVWRLGNGKRERLKGRLRFIGLILTRAATLRLTRGE